MRDLMHTSSWLIEYHVWIYNIYPYAYRLCPSCATWHIQVRDSLSIMHGSIICWVHAWIYNIYPYAYRLCPSYVCMCSSSLLFSRSFPLSLAIFFSLSLSLMRAHACSLSFTNKLTLFLSRLRTPSRHPSHVCRCAFSLTFSLSLA